MVVIYNIIPRRRRRRRRRLQRAAGARIFHYYTIATKAELCLGCTYTHVRRSAHVFDTQQHARIISYLYYYYDVYVCV